VLKRIFIPAQTFCVHACCMLMLLAGMEVDCVICSPAEAQYYLDGKTAYLLSETDMVFHAGLLMALAELGRHPFGASGGAQLKFIAKVCYLSAHLTPKLVAAVDQQEGAKKEAHWSPVGSQPAHLAHTSLKSDSLLGSCCCLQPSSRLSVELCAPSPPLKLQADAQSNTPCLIAVRSWETRAFAHSCLP